MPTILIPVPFADAPPVSFGSAEGQSVPGTAIDGSILAEIIPPGDCNADTKVDAGDITALVLEIFDGDGNLPENARGGSFSGNSTGCDPNTDGVIDAGDITCLVLIIFNESCRPKVSEIGGAEDTTQRAANIASSTPMLAIPKNIPSVPNQQVSVPVTFTSDGSDVSSVVFSIDFDEQLLSFDDTDADSNGLPDAVTITVPAGFISSATYDPNDTDGEIDVFIADISIPLSSLPDGVVAVITFKTSDPATSTEARVGFSSSPSVSFGDVIGQSLSGTIAEGSVLIVVDPNPPGKAPIELTPESSRQPVGKIFEIEVRSNAANNQSISGVAVFIDFDPSILQVVDADPDTQGVQLVPILGSLNTVISNEADNEEGHISYASGSLVLPYPTGAFSIAKIRFRGVATSSVTTQVSLSFDKTRETTVSVDGVVVSGDPKNAAVTLTGIR